MIAVGVPHSVSLMCFEGYEAEKYSESSFESDAHELLVSTSESDSELET